MKTLLFFILSCCLFSTAFSQTNIISTNPLAQSIMMGNYDPALYSPSLPITDPDLIAAGINSSISNDSLLLYLQILSSYNNRNTGSDTMSQNFGIGAARRWIYSKFRHFNSTSNGRLIPSYLQFDQNICGVGQHRNALAVLPGTDTSDNSIIIIEAHMDSRCEVLCDGNCPAEGMEDNGSGTALVIELARVMSNYSFPHTIVFMATTGEEQGLFGANAFANYCLTRNIAIKGVLNNDIVGGIICGQTSSAPSCPGFNHIDSTQVRLFSQGGFNSRNKGLSRFLKLEYQEILRPISSVPMTLTVMTGEDRTGRGGDHIPFRQLGYAAMRFTSANEHGNASNTPGYSDRQHTVRDILGLDLDSNGSLDTFFVDFNYLARNISINGTGAMALAIGPKTPDFVGSYTADGDLRIEITQQQQYSQYRIGIRTTSWDWDTVLTMNGLVDTIAVDTSVSYSISVASVDSQGVESLFSNEQMFLINGLEPEPLPKAKDYLLLQNKPNPFDESTMISFVSKYDEPGTPARILIYDTQGNLVSTLKLNDIQKGVNETIYTHGYNYVGVYIYQLEIHGMIQDQRTMIFAN